MGVLGRNPPLIGEMVCTPFDEGIGTLGGEPFKVVAALELFGTLMAVKVSGDRWPKSTRGMLKIGGSTDKGGNPHVLTRLTTSKFPLVVILAGLAAEMKANNWKLGLEWIPRGLNEEADGLTNWEFGRFSAEKRVEVDLQKVCWRVLERFMKEVTDLYVAVVALKQRKKGNSEAEGKGGPRKKKAMKLRGRDPWQWPPPRDSEDKCAAEVERMKVVKMCFANQGSRNQDSQLDTFSWNGRKRLVAALRRECRQCVCPED